MLKIIPHVISDAPQGSALGPMFFLLYINDIPGRPDRKLGFFAGDSPILAREYSPDRPCRNFSPRSLLKQWFSK
jgi:hypothetical protein